jgi:hypothetical protein
LSLTALLGVYRKIGEERLMLISGDRSCVLPSATCTSEAATRRKPGRIGRSFRKPRLTAAKRKADTRGASPTDSNRFLYYGSQVHLRQQPPGRQRSCHN